MEVPKYLMILWKSKWLLLVGLVVAVIGGLFAGFTYENGQLVSRTEQSYAARTTVLVNSTTQPMYQAVIPGQQIVEGTTPSTDVDLTQKAILYAYLVSGQGIRTGVESTVGEFADTEALTSLRRTTQPGGDEAFPGRFSLPIIDVVGISTEPDRAEEISSTATQLFLDQVLAEQEAAQIPEGERVQLTVLDQVPAAEQEGSNPAIPVVIASLGIFLLFVVAAFLIAGARASRGNKRAAEDEAAAAAAAADAPDAAADDNRPRGRRRRTPVSTGDEPIDELTPSSDREPARVG
ncbi:hypothetical protein [Microbacterium kunmingense]|uniref:hypothetical protein n=1 Tax=Microbacterium kunmingense TaxID=2915939 RepID=UPI003D70B4DE